MERREKISARLALPFAVLVATASLLSFLFNSGGKIPVGPHATVFWGLLILSCMALGAGAWFFRKAWFGHTDRLLPTASHIEGYYLELRKTYEDYENHEELINSTFESFLFVYYAQFSTENAINNDRRSYEIYRATVSLTVAVLLGAAASVAFFASTLLH